MFFWYVKAYISWKFSQYTMHWDNTQMLKRNSSDKINATKNSLFFFSQAPAHHSLTFNSHFLYELKHTVLYPDNYSAEQRINVSINP